MSDDDYLCVGVCMTDPDSGYCLGCGRPPSPLPLPADQTPLAEQTPSLARSSPTDAPDVA